MPTLLINLPEHNNNWLSPINYGGLSCEVSNIKGRDKKVDNFSFFDILEVDIATQHRKYAASFFPKKKPTSTPSLLRSTKSEFFCRLEASTLIYICSFL
jgi:hypothetical protein